MLFIPHLTYHSALGQELPFFPTYLYTGKKASPSENTPPG